MILTLFGVIDRTAKKSEVCCAAPSRPNLPPQTHPWARFVAPAKEEPPLQITISYGDDKVSTPLVKASQPLWNFWTQLADKGGSEELVFSLVQRDGNSGSL